MSNLESIWKESKPISENLESVWEQSKTLHQQVQKPQLGVETPQEKFHFLKQGGPSQFSDKPDFSGLPVGEPAMGAKAMALPFEPLAQVLRSPGAVSEAGLAQRPQGLEEKGASILDFSGHAFRGALRQGGSSEALIDEITQREDFGDTAEAFGRVVTEYGIMSGYAKGALKVLSGASGATAAKFGLTKDVDGIRRGLVQNVRKTFEKTVRPKGAKSLKQKTGYYEKATDSSVDIVKNKNNIILEKNGVEVKGELPETMAQWEQANNQSRTRLFDNYSNISTKAEQLAYQGNVDELIVNLEKFVDDAVYQHGKPSMVEYAKITLDDLKNARDNNLLSPKYMERMIQAKNENLKIRKNSPDQKIYHTATVDEVYAQYMNKALGKTVEKLPGGEGSKYRDIRRLYGAHAQVSKDISNAATRIAHTQPNVFAKGIETFTGYHALRGALSRNPATFTAAIASKGVNAIEMFMGKPHRRVTNMFKNVERGVRQIDTLTPIIQKATPPQKPPQKRIGWDGTFTRSGSGETIIMGGKEPPPGLMRAEIGGARSSMPGQPKTTIRKSEGKTIYVNKRGQEQTIYKSGKSSNKGSPLMKPDTGYIGKQKYNITYGKDGRLKLKGTF